MGSIEQIPRRGYCSLEALTMLALIFVFSCNDHLDNRTPAPMTVNPSYEAHLNAQEQKLTSLSESAQTQEAGFEQGADTEKISQNYLGALYTNINASRPEGMPIWEEMFLSLTSDDALLDPEFTLGRPGLVSNFYKQQRILSDHAGVITDHDNVILEHEGQLAAQKALLQSHDQIIGQMEKVMLDANADIAAQIKVVEDTIKNFDIRIRAMEIEGEKKRKDVGNFERRITILESSVEGIEKELIDYKLSEMSANIRQLQRNFTEAGTRIVNLETDVIKVDLDIQSNADAIKLTNNELIRVKDELNTKVVTELSIFIQDFASNKQRKVKEIIERLVALEAAIFPAPVDDTTLPPADDVTPPGDPADLMSDGSGI